MPRQTDLLTRQNPADVLSKIPSTSQDQHPFWTGDEKYIYFDSDRNSDTDTSEGTTFRIYRMFPDGTGITLITDSKATDHRMEPALSNSNNRLAFVSSTSLNNGFSLFVQDISSGTLTSLTASNPSGFVFADVHHPTWSASGNLVGFAGKLAGDTKYHIFFVNTDSGIITQMTNGPSNDYAPSWSPDGNLIAFTTNASGFNTGTAVSNGVNGDGHDDIWVVNPNPFTPNVNRVTSFTINNKNATNKNPSWSTTRPDPLKIVPPDKNANGDVVGGAQLLAFATNRIDADPNQPGLPTDIKTGPPTFDIYWMRATILPDPAVPGSFRVTTPETSGNPAHKLRTSTPDTSIDQTEPTFNFDPAFQTDEDFPTWPQYISSYRIAFQSNKGGNLNIWASTIFDINAPTLLRYDIPNNEIVHVARSSNPNVGVREVSAGEKVRFRVRLSDFETGIASAWIQIKNPNSQPQSADGLEHKVFVDAGAAFNTNETALDTPIEIDSQAINPYTYGWHDKGFTPPQFAGSNNSQWPGWNQYLAGIDDQFAFSGSQNPPDTDFWLRLYDDGPPSANNPNGHEPPGEVAGDGVYSVEWVTPPLQSDWYIDIIAYDNATDPFNANIFSNWKIYDNIWGFTTKPFQATNQILYVNDYDVGQRFFQSHFGTATNFLFTVDGYNGIPTESWMTEYDPGMIPTTWTNGTNVYPLVNVLTMLGVNSYKDGLNDDGSPVPPTQRYNQWRILSRGPVPDSVLTAYAPVIELQPPDIIGGGTSQRPVVVADRMIVWHAPYTGDLFVGPGTLIDGDTQKRLTAWVSGNGARGGRLFVTGQDVAWALTLGGSPGGNPFVNQVLKVNFTSDISFNWTINLVPGRTTHPISTEYWSPGPPIIHNYPPIAPGPIDNPPSAGPIYLQTVPGPIVRDYSALNQGSPDVVSFIPTPVTDQAQVDGSYASGAAANCLTWFVDQTTNSRVVFMSFGLESVNPESYSPGGNLRAFKNRPMEMMHNAGDFLRTGRIIGQALNVDGTGPLANVLVRAVSTYTNKTAATALTQSNGSYTLSGLDATGIYAIDAFKPGFITQHLPGTYFHGGFQSRLDLFLTKAQPGTISGTITRSSDGQPVAGAIVQAQDTLTNDKFTGTSQTDGTYTIKNVPASKYNITVINLVGGTPPTIGFASSIPASYTNVTVNPATDTPKQDFQLKALPGSISGKVTKADKNTGADTGVPLPNALVTATLGTTSTTAKTAADGTYSIPNLDPGAYNVVASAPGYATSASVAVTVTSNADSPNTNFHLQPVPPGTLSGLVSRTSDGKPVVGVTITLKDAQGNPILDDNGNPITGTTVAVSDTATTNYHITNVPAGTTIIVSASLAGYTAVPDSRNATITSGQETSGIDFALNPLQTFSAALSLVSAPYGYSTDVADLLGIPAADRTNGTFQFLTWQANNYVAYPTPPANSFALGRGYFLGYKNALALTTVGTALPTTPGSTFSINLQPGWNLIGDPYPFSIDFLSAKVDSGSGPVPITTAQGGPNPVIGSALWAYSGGGYQIVYTLDPWQGYWIRAFQSAKLIIDPANKITKSVKRPGTRSVSSRAPVFDNRSGNGWKLDLVAQAGQALSAPSFLGVHRAATNTYDSYKLEAPPLIGKQNVTLTFNHPDWGDKSGAYSVDVRSASNATQKWEFVVTSNVVNTPVTINWPAVATVPRGQDLILTDLDANVKMDLRGRAGYTLPASKTALTRRFSLEAHRATKRSLELVDVSARVNMGQDGRAAHSVGISYTLTSDATVQVTILQAGRRIRTIEPGRSRAAGSADATWDMRNDQGVAVSSNVYTVEVRAVDNDGHVARRVTPVIIPR